MPAFVLKFISGKYQGGEFPLPPGSPLVMGRASDADIVLVEDMVSRNHARIGVENDQVTLADLGSTNGTFVNGEKIQQRTLAVGDRILVGTSILKLRERAGEAVSAQQARQELERVGQREQKKSSMSGLLEEVPVPDLLQLFSTSKRTGILHIAAGNEKASIHLRDGNVFYASTNDNHNLGPMKALCRVVAWEQGNFEFIQEQDPTGGQTFLVEIHDETESLLMECLRQLDEFRRLQETLPPPHTGYGIQKPMPGPLSSLSAHELDAFQAVFEYGTLSEALNQCPLTDFEAATAIRSLESQGFIVQV